ncbi:MAG TPA: sigma-54-dependent Fis family transcriptional regulator [Vicinamibacterales bacterium]|nr:sigma-54-dependent Fis family transcriptional regulator [Vicinamibacterales bacterium]
MTQSWGYGEVSAMPMPADLESHLLTAVRKLTATLDVTGVCDAVLAGVESAFGATSSWIMLHDPERDVLRTAVFRGRGADVYASAEIPAQAGVVGVAFSRREIQFVGDVAAETRWFKPERVRASGLRSVFVLPLIAADRGIGVLGVDSPLFDAAHPPGPLDVKRLEVFAAQVAVGLVNARLYEASQQDRARLRALLRERRELRREVHDLRDEVRTAYSFGPIVGDSPLMRQVMEEVEQVAGSDVAVLLLGETGTGKELLARALHERSGRASRAFVPVNCAALPEALVESEMFGHERGAFTGAHSRKPGRFELAHRGTLFLDEIGDLPLNAQAKLLRVLQDGELHRVGSTQPMKVDVRLIAATHQDLPARIGERAFREDLFYRLSVFPIRIPPLRERPEDIPLLAEFLAGRYARRLGKRVGALTPGAIAALGSYSWPGNVRELQNVVERAVILNQGGSIGVEHIRLEPLASPAPAGSNEPARAEAPAPDGPRGHDAPMPVTLADAEREAIVQALRHAEGRVSGAGGAAALLGLKPTTLHAKMKKLGVTRTDVFRR